ncbi:alpha-tectorin-like [Clavelina lepadiformis]|uniref:alpha-tectorin-like n=1 Tax=Clavelina lepadiformis TaxID=159417 RepID=UPI004041E5E1
MTQIISDEGTGFAYLSTSVVPAPFNITGKEIKIQFSSDGSVRDKGFQITFEANILPQVTTTPPAATELFCGSQGQVNISLSNQTVNDLCGNDDDYVIISATLVDDVNSVDPECKADASDPNFNLDLSNCCILEVTGDVIKAHFPLRCLSKLNESEPIQRYVDGCLNLTCEYNRTELIEAGAIVPEIKKVALDSVEQEGRFGVKIYFTKNQSYSDKLDAGAEVKVPDLVYTKVELSTPDEALHVQLKECWATPSEDPDDEGTRYDIIKDGFPANNPFESDDAIEIDRNYMEEYAAFNFKAFVWSNNLEGAIYVYCRVTICHEDVDSGCPAGPSGNQTKKRDVASPDSLLVASGPIFISKSKKKSCEESNGGCSDVCEMRNDDVICMCYERRSLAEDGETCQDVEKYEVVAVGDDWTFLVYVIAAFVIVVGCLFVWSKKDGKSKDGFPTSYLNR